MLVISARSFSTAVQCTALCGDSGIGSGGCDVEKTFNASRGESLIWAEVPVRSY